jgi:hypothetical protein
LSFSISQTRAFPGGIESGGFPTAFTQANLEKLIRLGARSMPKPYSTDLRERAVEAVESGASRRNRFLGALNELSAAELHGMTHGDQNSYPALIAETVVAGIRVMIGKARYASAQEWIFRSRAHCQPGIGQDHEGSFAP